MAADTIGTFCSGLYVLESYGYTSAVRRVMFRTMKLLPAQHVSALLSISFVDVIPGVGCFNSIVVLIWASFVTVCIVEMDVDCQLLLLRDRSDACSFLPPIIDAGGSWLFCVNCDVLRLEICCCNALKELFIDCKSLLFVLVVI